MLGTSYWLCMWRRMMKKVEEFAMAMVGFQKLGYYLNKIERVVFLDKILNGARGRKHFK